MGTQATARAQNIRRPGPQPPRLYLSRAVRVIDVPVLCGHFITRAPALSHPALEHPLAYLDGIPLAPLVAAAAGESRREQIMSRWIERTPAQNASRIMDWMWALGILVAQSPQLDTNRL